MCPGELLVEKSEHLVDGCPPEEHRAADLVPRLDLAARVAGGERVLTAPLKRGELRASIARGELGEAHELPGVREVRVAADRFEDGDRPAREDAQGVGFRRRAHERDMGTLHLGPELCRLVAVYSCSFDRLGESCVGGVERSGPAKRPAEVREQRRAFRWLDREKPARSVEERGRRRKLVAIEHASPRASEELAAFESDGARVGVNATERRAVEVRLLEVVPHDLLRTSDLLPGVRFEPGSEPRMEIGAELFRHGCIRDVSDEHVVEAEAVVALDRALGRVGGAPFA